MVLLLMVLSLWLFSENSELASTVLSNNNSIEELNLRISYFENLVTSKEAELSELKDQLDSFGTAEDHDNTFQGDYEQILADNIELHTRVEDLENQVDRASQTLDVELGKVYSRWSNSMDAHMSIVSSSNWNEVSLYEVYQLIGLRTQDAISLLGIDYERVPVGIEGTFRGYHYKNHGIILASQEYYEEDEIRKVFLDDSVSINGTNQSMTLEDVMDVLGKTEIVEIQTEGNEYWLFYEYDKYTVEYRVTNNVESNLVDISITLPGEDEASWRFP